MRALIALGLALLVFGCQSKEEQRSEYEERAEAYLENEQWSEAKIELLNLLQLNPHDAETHYKLADAHWELQEFGDAIWQYREAVRLAPDNQEWRLRLAGLEFASGRRDEAGELVAGVLEADPSNVRALTLRARLRLQNDETDAALADLERAGELDPEDITSRVLKAQLLSRQGEPARAEETLREVVEIRPDGASYAVLAMFQAQHDRPEEAIASYRKAIETAVDDDQRRRTRLALANFLMSRQDFEGTERELLAMREEFPEEQEILVQLARFYVATDQPERAEAMLEARAEAEPDEPQHLRTLAQFYRTRGDRERAYAALERALERHPEDESSVVMRAEFLLEEARESPEKGEEARRIVAEVLQQNPSSLRAIFAEAKILLADREWEEAAARLRHVLEEQPHANTHYLLGTAYLAMRQTDLARAEFLSALQLDATHVASRTRLASLYLAARSYDLAGQEARKGLLRRPGDPELTLILADALQRLREVDKALEALAEVEFASSEIPRAPRLRAANLYILLVRSDDAREILESLLAEDPADVGALQSLVVVETRALKPDRAVSRIQDALQDHPDDAALYELRGTVSLGYRRLDDRSLFFGTEAERDLRKAIELDPTRDGAHVTLGRLLHEQGRLNEALASFRAALEQNPRNVEAYLRLGLLNEAMGRTDAAAENYQTLLKLRDRAVVPDRIVATAMNNLAWLLARAESPSESDLDRALSLAQDAKELLPEEPSIADTLGWVMYKRQIHGAAISLFREAIATAESGTPLRAQTRYHLALSYEANGEPDRAIEELKLSLDEAPDFPDRAAAERDLKRLQTAS